MISFGAGNYEVSNALYAKVQVAIDAAKQSQNWIPFKAIEIKTLARVESMGTAFCACNPWLGGNERLPDICKQLGLDPMKVINLLGVRFGQQVGYINFTWLPERVESAVALTKQLNVVPEKFIWACIRFGMFKLDGRLVLARALMDDDSFGRVAQVAKDPVLQVLELVAQLDDARTQCKGDFFETAEFWRTGCVTRDMDGYYGQVVKRYNEFRMQGHGTY
ncbi:MAG: hypothetical protein AB1457_18205 [Chloroflexota bacterium]